MPIQRYDIETRGRDCDWDAYPCDDGDWVKAEDCKALNAEMYRALIEAEVLVGDYPTIKRMIKQAINNAEGTNQ